jgi:hypothetical protein
MPLSEADFVELVTAPKQQQRRIAFPKLNPKRRPATEKHIGKRPPVAPAFVENKRFRRHESVAEELPDEMVGEDDAYDVENDVESLSRQDDWDDATVDSYLERERDEPKETTLDVLLGWGSENSDYEEEFMRSEEEEEDLQKTAEEELMEYNTAKSRAGF